MTFGEVTNSEHCDIDAVRLADVFARSRRVSASKLDVKELSVVS